MFYLYSKGCEYILRAFVCAAQKSGKETFRVEDVCREADVPEFFTRKSFQMLAQKGILKAVRGPGGGYALTKDPSKLSLLEIIKAVEGEATFERCAMGLAVCEDAAPCPIHEVWKKLKKSLLSELNQATLHQLIHSAKKKKDLVSRLAGKQKPECL